MRPQDDFYRFVNGTWLAKTEIPSDKNNYGAFTILQDDAEKNLHVIVEEAAAGAAATGSDAQLVGDFYKSYMDEAKAESLGLAPLQPELDRIAAIQDRQQLLDYLARAQLVLIDTPIGASVIAAAKNPDVNALWLTQSGLGLPERDYYFSKEQRFRGHPRRLRAACRRRVQARWTQGLRRGREAGDGVRDAARRRELARRAHARVPEALEPGERGGRRKGVAGHRLVALAGADGPRRPCRPYRSGSRTTSRPSARPCSRCRSPRGATT